MKRVIPMISLLILPRLLAAQDVNALAGEHWYGLYLNGQKCGWATHALSVDQDGRVTITEDARFQVTMVGIRQDLRIFLRRVYGAEGGLARIEERVDDVTGSSTFEAVVEEDGLTLRSEVGGVTTETRLPKPSESLDDVLRQAELVAEGAKVGDEAQYSFFEPLYQREISGTSRITGIEERLFDGVSTKVFKIKTTLDLLGIESQSYVTQDGIVLEDVFAQLLTMRLEPKELAQDVNYNNDVIVSNAAFLDAPIEDPRDREQLRLRIRGPLTPDHLFNDERQQFQSTEDGLEFTARRLPLDDFRAARVPVEEEEARRWVKPTLFVQSDHPKLVAQAKTIVDGQTDALEVSQRLCRWVHDNVRTAFSAQLTNALEVLDRREGDCTEYSILFIGLARAAGLPAREVAGLVYVDDPKPGFYFHQWAKVWVGKWVDVDPTFDQPVADVTHIKLAEGDLFTQAKLVPVIGQIDIEVIE